MRITTKLTIATSGAITLIFLLASFLIAHRELAFWEDQLGLHGKAVGQVVAAAARERWAEGGEQEARELLRAIDHSQSEITVRWGTLNPLHVPSQGFNLLSDEQKRALLAGQIVERVSDEKGSVLYTYVPISRIPGIAEDPSRRVIVVSESLAKRDVHVTNLLLGLAAIIGVSLLAAAATAHMVGKTMVGKPIAHLMHQARVIGEGKFNLRSVSKSDDELGTLTGEMNRTAERLAAAQQRTREHDIAMESAQAQLRRSERLATIGQLAAGVAHELATPLHAISLRAELLQHRSGDAELVKQSAEALRFQAARAGEIIQNLLRFSRDRKPVRKLADLNQLLDDGLALIEPVLNRRTIQLRRAFSNVRLEVDCDAGQIQQVLTNLVINAMQAMPQGGTIQVGTAGSGSSDPPGDRLVREHACFYVRDTGPGIPESVMPHIFDPFFTTKKVGEGTGLGLSISYGIVKDHRGWIDVDSSPEAGTTFWVFLPLSTKQEPENAPNGVEPSSLPH